MYAKLLKDHCITDVAIWLLFVIHSYKLLLIIYQFLIKIQGVKPLFLGISVYSLTVSRMNIFLFRMTLKMKRKKINFTHTIAVNSLLCDFDDRI